MFRKKQSAPKKGDGGGQPRTRSAASMGMFGMYGDDDDFMADTSDPSLEAELSQILGSDTREKKRAPPPNPKSKQLMDWSELDAQISASMKMDLDDEVEDMDDAGDLEAELDGLISDEEDSGLSAPVATKHRSPSPQPQATGGSQLQMLQQRKENYQTAIQNAQTKGEGSKVRRYQRGMKTLEDMLKKAKAGKPINEEEIPPQVATGKPPSAAPTPSNDTTPTPASTPAPPPLINVTQPTEPAMKPTPSPKPPSPTKPASPPKAQEQAGDPKVVEMLLHHQQEFKKAALTAKQAGNKEDAIKYFRIIKQFDTVIAAAKEGKPIDLSQMPKPPGKSNESSPAPRTAKPQAAAQPAPVQKPPEPTPQQAPATKGVPVPKTLLEGLIQRQQKYQSSADQAKAEGNGSKSRRMNRIVKQYDEAIRSHKAGKPVNVAELPVPMGYPPLPGMNEKPQDISDVLQQAGSIKLDGEESGGQQPQVVQAAMAASAVRQPARPSPQQLTAPKSPSRSPSPKTAEPPKKSSAYQNQIEFLVNRQAAFKEAALEAKRKGDKETAMDLLKKMKGFDAMIEQAKNGLKVDISKVPQPPIVRKAKPKTPNDDEFELLGDGKLHEDDSQIYQTLLETLKEQIKKARGYSEQFTHSGDVNGANMFDHLSTDSQRDYDFVKNLKRHGDPPPRYYFDKKTFESAHIIPELNSGELELVIVQILDIDAKDLKPLVEWEMPFPHDNPHKGRTEELKSSGKLQYDAHFMIPIVRKHKGFQRAVKNKAVKFDVIQKGGFLRSDKSLGTALVKLGGLETSCEVRAVEPLKEGRAITGRIEVKIRMRTPLISSESKTITEKWLVVSHEHVARRKTPRPSQGRSHAPTSATSQKQSSPKKAPSRHPKIHGSIEVLALERRMVEAKISDIQSKGQRPSTSVLQNQQSVSMKLNTTQRFLKEGGVEAKRAYIQFLKSEITVLTNEAQSNVKQGRPDQAKFSLRKRKMIDNEIQKMAPSNTYL